MKKVVMVCFWANETNCGDKSYVETTLRLLERREKTIQVELCDFYARTVSVEKADAPAASCNQSAVGKVKNVFRKFSIYTILKKLKSALFKKKKDYKELVEQIEAQP